MLNDDKAESSIKIKKIIYFECSEHSSQKSEKGKFNHKKFRVSFSETITGSRTYFLLLESRQLTVLLSNSSYHELHLQCFNIIIFVVPQTFSLTVSDLNLSCTYEPPYTLVLWPLIHQNENIVSSSLKLNKWGAPLLGLPKFIYYCFNKLATNKLINYSSRAQKTSTVTPSVYSIFLMY